VTIAAHYLVTHAVTAVVAEGRILGNLMSAMLTSHNRLVFILIVKYFDSVSSLLGSTSTIEARFMAKLVAQVFNLQKYAIISDYCHFLGKT
jgi:hypothetical protein